MATAIPAEGTPEEIEAAQAAQLAAAKEAYPDKFPDE